MTAAPDSPLATLWCPAPNCEARRNGLKPDMLLLHYTGMESAEGALDWLTRQELGVSCHYLIDEEGRIAQLVAELERAWHAGQSRWAGETDLNSCSIGIEIHNPGHDFDYPDFTEAEMQAVEALCLDILGRHAIPPQRVLAHSDVAPGRKRDPWREIRLGSGWRAPASGFGCRPRRSKAMPASAPATKARAVAALQRGLRDFGYGVEVTTTYGTGLENAVEAFQRHFRPARIDGRADASTLDTLERLLVARAQAAWRDTKARSWRNGP